MTKQRAAERKPLQELSGAVATGVKELKKALVAYDQRCQAQKRASSSAVGKRKKAKTTEPTMFDKALEQGNAIPTFSAQDVDQSSVDIDLDAPVIFKLAGFEELCQDVACFAIDLAVFLWLWYFCLATDLEFRG